MIGGSVSGVNGGWAYEDHIWFNRTPTLILQDVANNTISALNSVFLIGLYNYGAVAMDTLGTFGPAFSLYMDDENGTATGGNTGAKSWIDVKNAFGLTYASDGGINFPLAPPMSYFKQYVEAVNSCVIPGSPTYSNC